VTSQQFVPTAESLQALQLDHSSPLFQLGCGVQRRIFSYKDFDRPALCREFRVPPDFRHWAIGSTALFAKGKMMLPWDTIARAVAYSLGWTHDKSNMLVLFTISIENCAPTNNSANFWLLDLHPA